MTRKELESIFYITAEIDLWETELNNVKGSKDWRDAPYVEQKIREKTEELKRLKSEIDLFILSIPDSLTRMIVHMRAVQLLTWNEIATKVGGPNNEGTVKKRYYRFLEKCPQCLEKQFYNNMR